MKLGGENVCRVSDYSLFCRVVKRSRTGLGLSAFFTLSSNRLFFKVCKQAPMCISPPKIPYEDMYKLAPLHIRDPTVIQDSPSLLHSRY